VAVLREKKERGDLNEYEEASYWNQAHIRRIEEKSELTEKEVDFLCYFMLSVISNQNASFL
jgi:hypothetical protein